MNLNKVFLVGRLTKDAEYRQTQGGQGVTTAFLAVNRTWVDSAGQKKEDSQFFQVVFWGKQAEIVGKFCKKADTILVEGRIQTRKFVDKSGQERFVTEIVAESFQFGQKGQAGANSGAGDQFGGDLGQDSPESGVSSEELGF